MARDTSNLVTIPGELHSAATGNIVASTEEVFDYTANKYQNDINQEINYIKAVGYYECSTPGSTAAKTIAIDSSVFLSTKILCKVKFVEKNTAINVTMNINGTGTKALYYNGVRVAADNSWYPNEVVDLYYDGTNYQAKSCADTLEYDVSLHQTHEITEITTTTRTLVFNGDVVSSWESETPISDSSVEGYTRTETDTGQDVDSTTVDGPNATYDSTTNKTSVVYVTTHTYTHVVNNYTFQEAIKAVPKAYKHGGLKLRFISNCDSSNNKYVEYRLMSDSFSTTISNWQGVDDTPTNGSKNLVESGGVAEALEPLIGSPKVDYEWESNGYYIVDLSSAIGTALPSLTLSSPYRVSAKIPCSEGDRFIIHTRITSACAYFFLDSDSKLLYIPQDQLGTKYKDSNNNTEITAPTGSAFLVVQTNYNEWKNTEFGGDGNSGIYPYKKATQGIVQQVEQNTSDISTIQEQIGNSSSGIVKAITDLQISDSVQDAAITALETNVENIKGKFPKVYDKTKTYFTIEVSAGNIKLDSIYSATNIKNETPGSCSIDFGDGSPVVSINSSDDLQHNYTQAGKYTLIVTGLTGLTSNLLFRNMSILKDAKFGSTFVDPSTYFMLNGVAMESVTFFAETPLTWTKKTGQGSNMNLVSKIIVPKDSLFLYLKAWYFNNLSTNKDILTKKIVPDEPVDFYYRPITFTVGQSGDFTSINDAIQNISTSYPIYQYGGLKAVIKILSGTTITEQVYVDGLDLSWITIEYEDYNPEVLNYDNVAQNIANGTIIFDTTDGYNSVAVDASSWTGITHDTRGDVCLFRAENGGRLPIINCVFKLTTSNSSYPACGCLCNRGSEAVIKTLCGFIGFQDGVISNNESSITIREGITMNCSRWGCHARHNGEISARSVIATGCATDATKASEYGAAVADRAADMDVREAYLGGGYAIRCHNASSICARAAHVIGGGIENAYLVQATYSGKINASQMTFVGIAEGSKMFEVLFAGWIDAFSVTNKTYNVSTLNVIDSFNGIIFG